MKTLFFLVVIANVTLFMWEYKKATDVSIAEISTQSSNNFHEKIVLVSELALAKQSNQALAVTTKESPTNLIKVSDSKIIFFPKSPSVSEQNKESQKVVTPKSAANEVNTSNTKTPVRTGQEQAKLALADSLPPIETRNTVPVNAGSCYKLGPLINNKNYQALITQLRGTDSRIKLINDNEQKASGYIVFLPASKKPNNPDAYLLMLKQLGLKGFYRVNNGENKGQITLGTFGSEARALTLQKNLIAKGIKASIEPQTKNKKTQYAMLRTTANVMEKLEIMKKNYPQFMAINVPVSSAECL